MLKNWDELAGEEFDSLILGNGASMAVSTSFGYGSLLEYARSINMITEPIQKVFDYLNGTSDFELVLSMIWHAYHVNKALGVEDTLTTQAYNDVKIALITSVHQVHPEIDAVRSYLIPMYTFMSRFKTVVSLNYDLLVYWSMLKGNEELGQWFKDCFIRDLEFERDFERLRKPYGGAGGATLVFYPHGNLALSTSLLGYEIKIVRESNSQRLLGQITDKWSDGSQFPLFVSEGTTDQKTNAILRSGYLSTVFNTVLPQLGKKVVIIGWSMSDNDAHILQQVGRGACSDLYISVFRNGRDNAKIDIECKERALKIAKVGCNANVTFFDVETPGCWVAA